MGSPREGPEVWHVWCGVPSGLGLRVRERRATLAPLTQHRCRLAQTLCFRGPETLCEGRPVVEAALQVQPLQPICGVPHIGCYAEPPIMPGDGQGAMCLAGSESIHSA